LSKLESYYPTISSKDFKNCLSDIIISHGEKKDKVSEAESLLKKLWEDMIIKDKIDKSNEE